MTKEVIKRDGSRQPFYSDKIKAAIGAAARMAGCSEEEKEEIVEKVFNAVIGQISKKEVIATTEIEKFVLAQLDKTAPKVAQAWRKYRVAKEE
jgi:transcriptional regulator NrdR family protein